MKSKLARILMALVTSSVFVPPTPAQPPPPATRNVYTVTDPPQHPVSPVPPAPPAGVNAEPNGLFYQVQSGGAGPAFVARWNSAPDEANLTHEAERLARQLGEAKSDSDRDKLKDKLGEILAKQFDQRQKRHEREIEQLEAQVKKLKDLVAKRQENRREIIARRLEQILRESQGLGW